MLIAWTIMIVFCCIYYIMFVYLFNLSYGLPCSIFILQALIALKKGAQLLKYGRKGKPKFCPFRLSNVS